MKMSYRSAWLLVDSMNALFRKPVVRTSLGGRGGGSATLTDFGADVIRRYRSMESATQRAIAKDLAVLERSLRFGPREIDQVRGVFAGLWISHERPRQLEQSVNHATPANRRTTACAWSR